MNENDKTSRILFFASFIVVSFYLLCEPFFTLIYSINSKEYETINYPTFISHEGSSICSTILIVFALTFIAKNNTGILNTLIEGIKAIQSRSNQILKTVVRKK